MTTQSQTEALKLALEALETYKNFIDDAHIIEGQWHWINGLDDVQTTIKEALMSLQDGAQRNPLTKSQVLDLWEQTYVQRGSTGIEFARAVEAAHGIVEEKNNGS